MLEYSCSRSRMANWVLHQVGFQSDAIFPRKKGWGAFLRLRYPGDKQMGYFVILVTNKEDNIVFVPLDSTVKRNHVKQLRHRNLLDEKEMHRASLVINYQLIFITCEKCEAHVTALLDELGKKSSLMVLNAEEIQFVRGNFNNPRLEYRLSRQSVDADMIPDFLPANFPTINEGMTKSLFYQNIFFHINQCWLQGNDNVPLRKIMKNSIPYWRYYKKTDQKNIIGQIKEDLELVFQEYFEGAFKISDFSKHNNSHSETMISFPESSSNRKVLNNWTRKQNQALSFLRDDINPISIDVLNLNP